ncbi:MAG: hypothetical protein ABI841_06835 [Chloroflexota bacterium]
MSCGRVRRELLERFRFGELGPESAPHLDHLAHCHACRDEVGADRAHVAELRRALAARVGDASPPSGAWHGIVREAQHSEPRESLGMGWWSALVGKLRVATAMTGTGLALLLTLNLQALPLQPPVESPGAPTGAARPSSVRAVEVGPVEARDPAPGELGHQTSEPARARDGYSTALRLPDADGLGSQDQQQASDDLLPSQAALIVLRGTAPESSGDEAAGEDGVAGGGDLVVRPEIVRD